MRLGAQNGTSAEPSVRAKIDSIPSASSTTGPEPLPSQIMALRKNKGKTTPDIKDLRREFLSANSSQDTRAETELLDQMEKIDSKSREFLESKTRFMVESRELDRAMPYSNECVRLFPDSMTCLVDRADALITKGTKEEEQAALDACLKVDPRSMPCRNMLAILRMNQNSFADAVVIYEGLIRDNGDFGFRFPQWLLDSQLGFALEGAGRLNDALRAFEKSCASGQNDSACQAARSLRERL